MKEQKATNITWHQAQITRVEREKLLKQKSAVIWFTGLSGSGKSTLAHEVENRLYKNGYLTYVLDGDNVRHGLNKNLGFSPEHREENIRRIGEVANLFFDAGIIVMTAFISPYRRDRDRARVLIKDEHFIEVYCSCSLNMCEERDPKGLYKKARDGEIKEFTGISAPYEEPEKPELIIQTDQLSLERSADIVIDYLQEKKFIKL